MKTEELRIDLRVRINDSMDWNDNQTGTIFSIHKRKAGGVEVGVQLDNGWRFDEFRPDDLHAPFPELPNARADLPRIEDANRESGCEGNNRG